MKSQIDSNSFSAPSARSVLALAICETCGHDNQLIVNPDQHKPGEASPSLLLTCENCGGDELQVLKTGSDADLNGSDDEFMQ